MEKKDIKIMEEIQKTWLDEAIEREALPQSARTETTREFCAKRGIPESTYYYEVSKPETRKKILNLALNYAKRYTSDILEKIAEEAKKGNMKAAELYLKFIEQLNEKFDLSLESNLPVIIKVIKDDGENN